MLPNRAEISSLFINKFLFQLFSIGAIFLFLLPGNALAQTNPECPGVYGGACPPGQILVEKKVLNPKTGEFVQILSGNDTTFAPNDEVKFRIEVKNAGSTTLSGVSVSDRLPGNVNFLSSSPTGSFDQANNSVSWTINLVAGESRFFQIRVQVKPKNELNFDIACMTNFVQVQKDALAGQSSVIFCIQSQALTSTSTIINNINNQSQSQSQSQTVNVTQTSNVGIGTTGQVLGVTQLPKTGLPAVLWLVSGLIPLGFKLRGFALNHKTEEGKASYMYQVREFLKGGGEI